MFVVKSGPKIPPPKPAPASAQMNQELITFEYCGTTTSVLLSDIVGVKKIKKYAMNAEDNIVNDYSILHEHGHTFSCSETTYKFIFNKLEERDPRTRKIKYLHSVYFSL